MSATATAPSTRPGWALLGEFARLLLLAVVLPVLMLAGVLLWQASMSVRDHSAARLTAAAASGARDVDGFLQVHLAAMRVLADRRNSDGDIDDVARWKDDLARIHRHYPAFRTLLVTDADGRLRTSEPALLSPGAVSVADREYFKVPARTGQAHVSNAFRGRGFGNEALVAVSVPLHDGAFAGVVEGSIRIDSLLLQRGGLVQHGFELLLLDRDLAVVQATPGLPHRPLDVLGDSALDRDIARLARTGSRVQQLRAVMRDGDDAFALAVPLENGWHLVLLQPRAVREAELRATALAVLALLALVLGGVLAVVVVKMRRLGGSVRHLLERMQQFALDSGSAQVVPANMPRELLPLADAINALAARARASFDAVSFSLREQSRLREELQAVAQRLLTVQEDERRTLSRELHDDIGQSITAIKLAATSLTDDALGGDPVVRREILHEVIAIADQTVHKLRDLSLLLRPPQLDSLGLEAALHGQVARMARNSGLAIDLEVAPFDVRLPAVVELACFRIAQEALTNIARHAGATRVTVEVELEDGDDGGDGEALVLRVSDDGCGIDPARPGGLGLLTMRERATQLGGAITITPRRGGGTVLRAVLPMPALRRDARQNA